MMKKLLKKLLVDLKEWKQIKMKKVTKENIIKAANYRCKYYSLTSGTYVDCDAEWI